MNTNSQHQTAVSSSSSKQVTTKKSTRELDHKIEDMSSRREQMIQQRQKDAAESKARTLQMYDNMAKSGSAGDYRQLDINTYRGKPTIGGQPILSGAAIQKTDLVEETIRERVRASEENKRRLLAAYDYAAKTQPAGTVRDVDLAMMKGVDVSQFEQDKPQGSATFQSSNGIPSLKKANSSVPTTPVHELNKAPSFVQEQPHLDAYERALRQRKQEADERKARTLAAYDAIARSGVAGPKIVVREELEHMELPPADELPKPKYSCTSSFSGGYARN